MTKLTPEACRAARAILGFTTQELAARIGVSPTTINSLEQGNELRPSSAAKIMAGLAELGIEVLNGDAPGARLRIVWRVDFAKAEPGFTVHPRSGQGPQLFPIHRTQQEMRDWLQANGYRMLGENPDIWTAA